MDYRVFAFTVAATGLLAASCAGTKQDAANSDVGNFTDEASEEAPVKRTTSVNTQFVDTPLELSPQIQEACRPYRIPDLPFTLHPDSDLRKELGGLTNCLVYGPLYDRDLEIVRPDSAKLYFGDAVIPLRETLIEGGVSVYRIQVVPAEDAGVAPVLTLQLANADAET